MTRFEEDRCSSLAERSSVLRFGSLQGVVGGFMPTTNLLMSLLAAVDNQTQKCGDTLVHSS